MRLGTPCRNDAPFLALPVCVDDRNLQSTHQPDGVHPPFAIIKTVIDPFDGWAFENAGCVFKRNSVQLEVAAVLPFIPTIAPKVCLHNVNIKYTALSLSQVGGHHGQVHFRRLYRPRKWTFPPHSPTPPNHNPAQKRPIRINRLETTFFSVLHTVPAGTLAIFLSPNADRFPASLSPSI